MNYAKQNSTAGFYIFADSSSALGTGATGLTISVTLAKSSASASALSGGSAPTITEVGNGWYWVVPVAANRNTLGANLWQFSATGAVIAGRVETIGLFDFGVALPANFSDLNITQSTGAVRVSTNATGDAIATTLDTEAIQTTLDAIQAKTDLIGTASIGNISFLAANGAISEIIIGDDYLNANGRAFAWTVPAIAGLTVGQCTCKFGGSSISASVSGSWEVTGTISDNGNGTWTLRFDLPRTATENCEPGFYDWSAAVHGPTGTEITKVRKGKTNRTQLVRKYT